MEIGNQVFMQYKRNEDGSFSELEQKNVDFGAGLERIAAASINSFDVFKISLLKPIVDHLELISHQNYDNHTDEMRIIADHLRGAYLLASQGLKPSNKQQGYALRRLIRRAILKALDLGIAQNFITEIIPIIAKNYQDLPDSILTTRDEAISTLEKEEKAFRQTLNKGLRELQKMVEKDADGVLTGDDLFKLQDTYGFPFEVSVEEIYRQNIKLSENYRAEFDQALKLQRERSQTASKGMFKGGLEDHGETTTKYHTATHLTLAALQKILDPSIGQAGSNITADRMRFDFNFERKLTDTEKQAIEDQVNAWIKADLPVTFAEYDKEYARDVLHAHGQFWEKYPAKVKVYAIGDPEQPVSREVCGGPHVEHTGQIGCYKIKKEESSAAGIRRIKAVIA